MATSVATATSASTTDAAYAPTRSKRSKRSLDEQRQRLGAARDAAGDDATAPNSPSARAVVSTTP